MKFSMGGKSLEVDIREDVKHSLETDRKHGTNHTEKYLGYIKADIYEAEKALEHMRMLERVYTEELKGN